MKVQIHIDGKGVEPVGDLWRIASESFLSVNDFGVSPVKVEHEEIKGVAADFVQQLPAHSATTLELTIKPQGRREGRCWMGAMVFCPFRA